MFLHQGLFKIILLLNYSNMDSGQHKLNRNQFTLAHIFYIFQERIRIGKELLEAKRIEEQNERKRLVSFLLCICACTCFCLIFLYSLLANFFPSIGRMIELRRLEKEEEKRAREKIRQKLEEDKVSNFSTLSLRIFLTLSFKFLIDVGNTNNLALKNVLFPFAG